MTTAITCYEKTVNRMAQLPDTDYLDSANQVLRTPSSKQSSSKSAEDLRTPKEDSTQKLQQERVIVLPPVLPFDMIRIIFEYSVNERTSRAFGILNKEWNTYYQKIIENFVTSGRLTVIDAKAMQIKLEDEPLIDQGAVIYHCHRLAPHILNNVGLSLVTIPKGISILDFQEIVKKDQVCTEKRLMNYTNLLNALVHGDENVHLASEKCSYRALIPNNGFAQTCVHASRFEDLKHFVGNLDCEIPTVQELFFQICASKVVFNKAVCTDYFVCCSNWSHEGSILSMRGSVEAEHLFIIGKILSHRPTTTGSAGVIRCTRNNSAPK